MRGVLVAGLVLAMVLSGCAGQEQDDGGDAAASDATGSGTASGTGSKTGTATASSTATGTGSAANNPPTAVIAATVNGTEVVFELKGADTDGDALAWNLTFGDGQSSNGTDLPANVTHEYVPGSFLANLTVSDGKSSTVQNVTVNVTAAPLATTTQTASGDWVSGNMVTGCFGDIFAPVYPEQGDGVFYASFAVDPATIGQSWAAVITSDGAADSPGFTFMDSAGEVLSSSFELSGTVPEGAAKGIWWVCAGGPMSGTYQTPA